MAGVRLQQLVKRFDDGAPAVDGVSLDIRDGEFVVLVGPSGCGKSTILRMIAGLEIPTSGSVFIGDDDVTDRSPRARDVAMVFQNYALYPHLTVRENIAFPLRMRGDAAAAIRGRVADVAGSLGIGDLLDRRPGQLSGGQRQRVALARAMVRKPSVFLFDEPLSNLDAQVRATARAELVLLHRMLGATMIYVTHDQVEALSMAQRMAVMRAGRVEHCAAPMDVYRAPATLFVASFIGMPAINALRGRVVGEGARQRFEGPLHVNVSASPTDEATLTIRPEDLRVAADGHDASMEGEVILVEALGAESVLHVRLPGGEDLRLRRAGSAGGTVGARVRLAFEPGCALVYDRDGRLAGRGA